MKFRNNNNSNSNSTAERQILGNVDSGNDRTARHQTSGKAVLLVNILLLLLVGIIAGKGAHELGETIQAIVKEQQTNKGTVPLAKDAQPMEPGDDPNDHPTDLFGSVERNITRMDSKVPGTVWLNAGKSELRFRIENSTHRAVFRTYVIGPERRSAYFEPTTIDGDYEANVVIHRAGQYFVLVVQRSNYDPGTLPLDQSMDKNSTCAPTSIANYTVNMTGIEPLSSAALSSLPECGYSPAEIGTYNYSWVSLKSEPNPANAIVVPAENLDGIGTLEHFIKYWTKGILLPYQKYAYTAHDCRQSWISSRAFLETASAHGGFDLVMVGTSRGRHTTYLLQDFLGKQDTVRIIDANVANEVINRDSVRMNIHKVLTEKLNICAKNDKKTIILVSHGIWEAVYFKPRDQAFHFEPMLQDTLDTIETQCANHTHRVLLMTEPQHNLIDGRDNFETFDVHAQQHPRERCIRGPRLNQVVNPAYYSLAKKHNLPLIDAAQVSLHRPDACFDGAHYVLGTPTTKKVEIAHKKPHGNENGNEVTVTFAQMVLRAITQMSFD